jgi:hypothetical protein
MKKAILLFLTITLILLPIKMSAIVKPEKVTKGWEPNNLIEFKLMETQIRLSARSNVIVTEIKQEIQEESHIKSTIPLSEDVQEYAWDLSNEFKIPYEIIWSVVNEETGGKFNPKLTHTNNNGTIDYGLMQLNNGGTMQWLSKESGIKDFTWSNPKHNLRAGVWYLNYLRDMWIESGYGESENLLYLTILSYNMGFQGALRYEKKQSIFNWKYVSSIHKYEMKLKEQGKGA